MKSGSVLSDTPASPDVIQLWAYHHCWELFFFFFMQIMRETISSCFASDYNIDIRVLTYPKLTEAFTNWSEDFCDCWWERTGGVAAGSRLLKKQKPKRPMGSVTRASRLCLILRTETVSSAESLQGSVTSTSTWWLTAKQITRQMQSQ